MVNKMLDSSAIQLPPQALVSLLSPNSNEFVFIKDDRLTYQYANQNFTQLMGFKAGSELQHLKDSDLCRDQNKAKRYKQDSEQVIESITPLTASDDIEPLRNPTVSKVLSGVMYPILGDTATPIGILGIFTIKNKIFQLSLELAVNLTDDELNSLLVYRSYPVKVFERTISLSKRELQCLIGLIQGKHAGDIAKSLILKQETIEFYLDNLKNKLGADSKSSLMNIVFNQKIIQQIIL